MREYGKVQTEFWEHPGVRRLSTEAKLLYVYLLTGPHTNMAGCFKVPKGYVADDLGWVSETVSGGFRELSVEGFVTYDDTTRYVLVHGFLKFNRIVNRNIAVPMMEWFREVPDRSPLKPTLAAEIVEFVDKIDAPMRAELEPFLKPFREGYPNPENREQGTVSREEDIGTSSLSVEPAAPSDGSAGRDLVLVSPEPASARKARARAEPTAAEQKLFDEFWSIYPRRVAKQPALEAYLVAIRRGVDPEAILHGLRAYASSRLGKDPEKTAHAATWLNAGRWTDEIEAPPPGGYNDNRPGGGREPWNALDQAAEGFDWSPEDAA